MRTHRSLPSWMVTAFLLAAAVSGLAACAGNRAITIPPVEPVGMAGMEPVPASVGVQYQGGAASREAVQVIEGPEGKTTYTLPIGAAMVDGYDALLPLLFTAVERLPPGALLPGSPLEGTLEVVLDEVQVALPAASETQACRVAVAESFTLRDRTGKVVASWKANGAAQVPRGATVDCGGKAASGALQNAQVAMIRGLEEQREVRTWLAGMGRTWKEPSGATETRRTLARASEEVEAPPDPRVFGVYGGVGYFGPQDTEGAVSPTGGLALALGASWRPLRWVGAQIEAGNLSSQMGGVNLNQTLLALLARVTYPIAFVEPFVAGGPLVDFVSATRFSNGGAYTTRESVQKFVAGAILLAGLDFVVASNVELGARWQWLWAQADLSPFQSSLGVGTVKTGGQSILVTGGYYWP